VIKVGIKISGTFKRSGNSQGRKSHQCVPLEGGNGNISPKFPVTPEEVTPEVPEEKQEAAK